MVFALDLLCLTIYQYRDSELSFPYLEEYQWVIEVLVPYLKSVHDYRVQVKIMRLFLMMILQLWIGLDEYKQFLMTIKNFENLKEYSWLSLLEYQSYEKLFKDETSVREMMNSQLQNGVSVLEESIGSIQKFLVTNKLELEGQDTLYLEKAWKSKKGDNLLDYASLELDQPNVIKGQVLVTIIRSLLNLVNLLIENHIERESSDDFYKLLIVSLVQCAKFTTSNLLQDII